MANFIKVKTGYRPSSSGQLTSIATQFINIDHISRIRESDPVEVTLKDDTKVLEKRAEIAFAYEGEAARLVVIGQSAKQILAKIKRVQEKNQPQTSEPSGEE